MMYSYDAMQLNVDLKTASSVDVLELRSESAAPAITRGVTVYISLITSAHKWRYFVCGRVCVCVHICCVHCV